MRSLKRKIISLAFVALTAASVFGVAAPGYAATCIDITPTAAMCEHNGEWFYVDCPGSDNGSSPCYGEKV